MKNAVLLDFIPFNFFFKYGLGFKFFASKCMILIDKENKGRCLTWPGTPTFISECLTLSSSSTPFFQFPDKVPLGRWQGMAKIDFWAPVFGVSRSWAFGM